MDFKTDRASTRPSETAWVWFIGVTTILMLAMLAFSMAKHEIDGQLEAANDITTTSATALAKQFAGQIGQVDQTLGGLESLWQLAHKQHLEKSAVINYLLRQRSAENPILLNLAILNPEGRILHWAKSGGEPPDVSDRQYVRHHLDQPDGTLFIGKPNIDRVDSRWFMAMSRPVHDEKKNLQAILVAYIDLGALSQSYLEQSRKGSTLTIHGVGGEIIMRIPDSQNYIGKSYKDPLDDFIKRSANTDRALLVTSPLDNRRRMARVEKVKDYPFYAFASVVQDDLITSHKPILTFAGLMTATIGLLILYFTYRLANSVDRQHKLKSQSDQQHRFVRSLMDAIPDLIFFKDQDLVYQNCNKAFAKFVDRPENQILGADDFEIFEPDNAKTLRAYDYSVLAKGTASKIEEPAICPDGRGVTFETLKIPVVDNNGHPGGIIGISRDITQRKHDEKMLKNREEEIRLLLSSTGEGIFGVDLEGRCTFCNQSAAQMLGLESPDDLIGSFTHATTHHTHKDGTHYPREACKIHHSMLHNKALLVEDEVFWRADGSAFPVRYRANPILKAGEVSGVVVSFTDITLQLEQQKQLNVLSQAIKQSPSSVVITNPRAEIEYVNPQFEKLTGYSADEVVGKNARIVQSGRTDIAVYQDMWSTILDGVTWYGELLNKKKSGEFHWESVAIAPIKNDGEITHFVAIKTDISALKDQEMELWQLANFDQLTQLANRNLFNDRLRQGLARAKRETQDLALLYLDLDRFKPVNDRFGHDAGDAVLRTVALCLGASIRAEDTAARMGGDEFVVLLEGRLKNGDLAGIAQKIIDEISTPIEVNGHQVSIGCSIGIARYPDDGSTIDTLITAADSALYEAKERGRGRYVFKSPPGAKSTNDNGAPESA